MGSQRIRKVERKRRIKTVLHHDSPRGDNFHNERKDNPMNELCRSKRTKAEIGCCTNHNVVQESL